MASAALLAACGGGSAQPSSAAAKPASGQIDAQGVKADGKAVGYGELADSVWKVASDDFQQKYGVPVENYRANVGPVIARVEGEEAAGKHNFDVILLESSYLDGFARKGYIQKLPQNVIEHAAEKWRDPQGYWAGVTLTPLTILYNKTLVDDSQAPKKLEDILDPKWKGKIAMIEPTTSDIELRWFYQMRQKSEDGAKQFLTALAAQNPTPFESGVTVSSNLNQGQFPIAISYLSHVLSVAGPNGNLAYMRMDPMPATGLTLGLAAEPAHAHAAPALADMMLSTEFLQKVAGLGYPVNAPGVKSAIPGADGLNFDVLPALEPAKTEEMVAYVKGIFRK
jgi:iron(III) transport system substrate-binding protein